MTTDPQTDAMIAFHHALGAVQNVAKTQTADTGKYTYSYADLGDVLDECKRACQLHDLAITQWPTVVDGHLAVHTYLIHGNGVYLSFPPLMMALPKDAQAYGSALTYGRRYGLLSIFGIAPEDDDGRAATVAAHTQPGRRTEAERMIREQIGTMDEAMRAKFMFDFKTEFGSGLAELAANRHGAALLWSREWASEYVADDAPDDTDQEAPA